MENELIEDGTELGDDADAGSPTAGGLVAGSPVGGASANVGFVVELPDEGTPSVAIAGGWGIPAGDWVGSMFGIGEPIFDAFLGMMGGGAKDCVDLPSETGEAIAGGANAGGASETVGVVSLGVVGSMGESSFALGMLPSWRLDSMREASNRGGSLSDFTGGISPGFSDAKGAVWDASLVSYCGCTSCVDCDDCTIGNAIEASSSNAAF